MAKDLKVTLTDQPGEGARLGEALGNAGVNIEGLCAIMDGGMANVHVLVDDVAGARAALEGAGMLLSGISPDSRLVEIVELKDHPWFVASQFHPEFKSRPERPHPLFHGFVATALALRDGVETRLTAVGPGPDVDEQAHGDAGTELGDAAGATTVS